jgi:hypothetical protein
MAQQRYVSAHFFKCKEEGHKAFGLWGFKIKLLKQDQWFTTHKTRYEFTTREEAVNAAKAHVEEFHPGQWIEKKLRSRGR